MTMTTEIERMMIDEKNENRPLVALFQGTEKSGKNEAQKEGPHPAAGPLANLQEIEMQKSASFLADIFVSVILPHGAVGLPVLEEGIFQ